MGFLKSQQKSNQELVDAYIARRNEDMRQIAHKLGIGSVEPDTFFGLKEIVYQLMRAELERREIEGNGG